MNPFLARFRDQPALIEEGHNTWLESCLNAVAERRDVFEKAYDGEDFWGEGASWLRPYEVKDGILYVPVKGVLLNDFPYAFFDWATGYEYIWAAIKRGLDDSNVNGIALVVNSGGGMVAGNFDLVDRIYEARSQKPIRAFAAEHAYSAAYNIAAAAEHVTVARTGGVGSIGVIVTQVEMSRALDTAGITVNLIRSKPDKMEGNPYEALSDGARKRIQERVNAFHDQFVALVARNRGMEAKAVDDTDAHTFMAQQAIDNGLADAVGALDDAILAFGAAISEGDDEMAGKDQAANEEALAAATAAGEEKGKAAGKTEGRTETLTRINAIIDSDAGKVRPKAALHAALKTSMSVEEATAFLAALPEEGKQEPEKPAGAGAPEGMLSAAMDGTKNPDVGAGDGTDADDPKNKAEQDRALIASYGLAGFNNKE